MSPNEIQETVDYIYICVYGPLVAGTIIYLIWMKRKKKNQKDKVEDL